MNPEVVAVRSPDAAMPNPGEYFAAAQAAFNEAAARTGRREHRYSVAGAPIQFTFAGPALEPVVLPGLAREACDRDIRPDAIAARVCLFDSRSTGVAMPAPPWTLGGTGSRGEVHESSDDTVWASFHIEGTILTLFDRTSRTALYWIRDADDAPYYERAAPLRSLLSWALSPRGLQLVHAAAVGHATGCVLLAGKGGSGKSNLALGCLEAGLSYLGDDYCVVGAAPHPVAYGLYTTGKVHAADLDRQRFLRAAVSNRDRLDTEKAVFYLAHEYGSRLLQQAPIVAVLLPHVTDRVESRLRPASAAEGLLALAPSTTSQLPHAGGEVMRTIAAVVRQVPCYHLDIGSDGDARVRVATCLSTHAAS